MESYVITGMVASGSFLAGFFAIFRYMVSKIESMSREHTTSMVNVTERSFVAQEKVADVIQQLDKTLSSRLLEIPTMRDLTAIKDHFDTKHSELQLFLTTGVESKVKKKGK